MAFVTPYTIKRATTYKGNVIKTSLSLAIRLIDDFTKKEAIGCVKVIIKEGSIKPIKNLSGYYIFTDLADVTYTVSVTSEFYFPEERVIDISKIKTSNLMLKFYTKGPASGATSTKLKDISKLQNGDIVEFRNLGGDIEPKKITYIDVSTSKILWAGELKYIFAAAGSTIHADKNPVVSVVLKPQRFYPFPDHATLVRGLLIDSSKNPVVNARVKIESYEIVTESDESGEFVFYFNNIQDKNILIKIEINGQIKLVSTDLEEGITKSLGRIVC